MRGKPWSIIPLKHWTEAALVDCECSGHCLELFATLTNTWLEAILKKTQPRHRHTLLLFRDCLGEEADEHRRADRELTVDVRLRTN